MSKHAQPKDGDPLYLKKAISQLGLSEIQGKRHEKRILEMYAAAGHPEVTDDETAWCAAFVGWALYKGGLPNTGNLMARSYARYGDEVTTERIPRGAIAVWPRGAPPSGHVNFVLHDDGRYVTCIGGNQSNGAGGGVTVTRTPKYEAVAFRLPKKVTKKPKPAPAPAPEPLPPPPDIEPVPEVKVPWWKKPFVWLGGALSGGLLGGASSLSVDGQFWLGLSAFAAVAFVIFALYVYVIPPRGKIQKGWK